MPDLSRVTSFDPHNDPLTGTLKKYIVLAGPGIEEWATTLQDKDPQRFQYRASKWEKFADGTDHIMLGGFNPTNEIRGSHVLFLATFANNDVTLAQYYALVSICESFVESLTILLPYYPTATMERVLVEGEVATANTLAKMLSHLPPVGKPIRVMVYDLHTLQNRFYFADNALATLHTAFPMMIRKIRKAPKEKMINCVAFPDDGAEKRFKYMFAAEFPDMEVVVCSKKRDISDPAVRKVVIKDGFPQQKRCLIVDDLVQTGGTLHECGKKLLDDGAESVSAFVVHSIFPNNSWQKFAKGGARAIFESFYTTDSNPHVVKNLPINDVFEVLPLMDQVIEDL